MMDLIPILGKGNKRGYEDFLDCSITYCLTDGQHILPCYISGNYKENSKLSIHNLEAHLDLINGKSMGGEGFIVTNHQKLYGAAEILSPYTIDRLVESVGDSFWIIPSSVHEVIVYPDNGEDPERFRRIIKSMNELLNPNEVLSNNVWKFSDGKIQIA